MDSISYKEFNKPMIAKIIEILEKFPNPEDYCNGIEILIEYKDKNVIKHDVARYWKNDTKWIGTIGNMFDFDFYEVRKIVGFAIMEDVIDIAMESTDGNIFYQC